MADFVPQNERSAVFGKSGAFGSIGFILGPIIGGHIVELENGFFYVCCLTSVIFLGLLGILLFLV